jgi:hypothetical protein
MSLCRSIVLAAIIALPASSSVPASELIRIEPRPYYGAVVSIENGVRVYRGLPSQSLMIINPDKTPVSLNFSRTIEHKAADASSGNNNNGGGASGDGNGSGRGSVSYSGLGTNPTQSNNAVSGVPSGVRVHKMRDHKPKHN